MRSSGNRTVGADLRYATGSGLKSLLEPRKGEVRHFGGTSPRKEGSWEKRETKGVTFMGKENPSPMEAKLLAGKPLYQRAKNWWRSEEEKVTNEGRVDNL